MKLKTSLILLSGVIFIDLSLWCYWQYQSSAKPAPIANTILSRPSPVPQIPHIPQIHQLTLTSIFSPDHAWLQKLPKDQVITLITTGDIIPARVVNWKMAQYHDFTYPFASTAAFLKNADLTLINLEAPLVPDCPVTREGMVFCGDQKFTQGLTFAGVDVVNLANNHALNWGSEGLCQTTEVLRKSDILATGLPEGLVCPPTSLKLPKSLTTKNLRFGFLGWDILENPDQGKILESIRQTKSQTDFLVVSFHWGAEYQRFPAPETVQLARQAIEAGADLIVGNHPHWFQPIEIYQGKPIIYAHGNFIFDQEWSRETKTGYITKYYIYQGKVVDLEAFPVFIEDYNQPHFLEGETGKAVFSQLQAISEEFAAKSPK